MQPQNITASSMFHSRYSRFLFFKGLILFIYEPRADITCQKAPALSNLAKEALLHVTMQFSKSQSTISIFYVFLPTVASSWDSSVWAHCCSKNNKWCTFLPWSLACISRRFPWLRLPFTLSFCSIWGQFVSCGHVQGSCLHSCPPPCFTIGIVCLSS